VKTNFEYIIGNVTRLDSDPERKTGRSRPPLAERLASLERAIAGTGYDTGETAGEPGPPGPEAGHDTAFYPAPGGARVASKDDERTERIISAGRHTARRRRVPKAARLLIAAGALVVFIAVFVMTVFRSGPSWPASVAVVQTEIAAACQDPDVVAEPTQVNFACGQATSQILWVFALLTSNDNPGYADAKTGRKGLEPITPAQGGEIAWSLNLHHPYSPSSPVDSLEVAARAINNIIGGATLTGTNGNPVVQSGLESKPENCARYTGSPAITARAGFPTLCASPVTSGEGQAALVADVYRQWMPGATPVASQDASVLFEDANNPGDPQVQAILKTLPGAAR